jgi:heme/copper-type cytochrome/quinol oxidase subunit 2
MNALYWVMLVIVIALAVVVNGALIALAVRYRSGRGREARRLQSGGRTQLVAGGALAALAAVVFVLGVIFTERAGEVEKSGAQGLQASALTTAQRNLEVPTGDDAPLEIKASGQQWLWRYEYPDGTFSYYELVVPVDTAVQVQLSSVDVVHRWWVQGLSAKVDAVPGTGNQTWFKADEEGTYDGASYAFSGAGYSTMRTKVRVLSVPAYEAWLEEQAADIAEAQAIVQRQISAGGPLELTEEGKEP